MAKLTLSDLVNLENQSSAVATINANSAATETALENTLSRDGTTPNVMGASLDMNSNQILNLPSPSSGNSPVRLGDLTSGADSLSVASQAEAIAATSNSVLMTPLRTSQELNALINTALGTVADVYCIVGQSNAVGQGTGGPTVPPSVLKYFSGTISTGNDPVGGNGSAWPAFGLTYTYSTGRNICFVPAAFNGSSLIAANNTVDNWSPTGYLRYSAVAAITSAMTALRALGYNPIFKGFLISDGETDAAAPTGYQAAFADLLTYFRGIYGATTPAYIFRTGRLTDGAGGDTSGFQNIRAQTQALVDADPYSHIVFYNAVDFPGRNLMTDSIHYSQTGYNEMGRIGAANVIAELGYGGPLRIAEDSTIYFGGNPAVARSGGNYHVLSDAAGGNAILLGGTADKQNYFRNDTNRFQLRDSTDVAFINGSGITASDISSLTSLGVKSSAAAFYLRLVTTQPYTADRTLTINQGDGNRVLNMGGNWASDGALTFSGAYGLTFTLSGATSLTLPVSGAVISDTSTNTLTNKTLTSPAINGGAIAALTSLGIRSTAATFDMKLATTQAYTATRTLTVNIGDSNRTLALSGDVNTAGAFTTSGANSLTLTTTGSTNVTLPTTGTLLSSGGTKPTTQVFASGSGTYTTPAGVLWIEVKCLGGGGGGAGSGTSPGNGGSGGNTTFSTITASGGVGASGVSAGSGGAASGGDLNIAGSAGQGASGAINSQGGFGASGIYGSGGFSSAGNAGGSASANTGAGGGGAGDSSTANTGAGGGSSGYCEKIISSPSATYSYAVGAGGSAGTLGTGGAAGGAGGSGFIKVVEHYGI